MYEFVSVNNLLEVAKILSKTYSNYYIYVCMDKCGIRLFKFVNKFNVCTPDNRLDEFEIVIVNDFELIKNKKSNVSINLKALNKRFKSAMIEVCGQAYKTALVNFLNYKFSGTVFDI